MGIIHHRMKFIYLITTALFLVGNGFSQAPVYNTYQQEMNIAYQQYPDVPKGIIEAVSFTQTHFSHLDQSTPESCFGLPKSYGVMGLVEDGKGYFKNNLHLVAQYSGYSVNDIKASAQTNILAFAAAYDHLMDSLNIATTQLNEHDRILRILSELPISHNTANEFALNSHLYSVFSFLQNTEYQSYYGFPNHGTDMVQIFGSNNYQLLSSGTVQFVGNSIQNQQGVSYQPNQLKTSEYGPALWVATPTCNYSSRNGTAVSAVTIHTIQGSYAGAISWAQNCSANVSYHYVVRSSDGQVTQMLLEADKGWHVGSENPYCIGIEHEGYVSDPSWYTTALYTSSSDLCRDITQSGYGINPLRTYYGASSSGLNTLGGCTKIKGHQHYPNQSHTDPGINWDWERFYKLINNSPAITANSSTTGSYYDTGGPTGNYSDDERELYLIQPTGAGSVTITFNSFDLELNWDYLFIYDGATTDDPLIGTYTGTTNPGTITSSGGSLLIEFRSDCATNNAGWDISWTSTGSGGSSDITPPTTVISSPNNWETTDFTSSFTDTDNSGGSGVNEHFYQVIDFDGTDWRANANDGFFSDNFDLSLHADWTTSTGTWNTNGGYLEQSDEAEGNSNIYASLNQSNNNQFLYHWSGNIDGTGTNKRAGFHFMCDDATLPNRGNSYFVWFRTDNNKIQIYKVVNDVFSLEVDQPYTLNDGQWYDFKVVYDKTTGEIAVWVDNVMSANWVDPSPYTAGNAISFRSGESYYLVNNLKVYHDRSTSELITVGSISNIRYENTTPTTPSGRVKSIIIDSADNVSSVHFQDVNVDWTIPDNIITLNDGLAADEDNTTNNTQLSANWTASIDTNSSIARYWYCIGSTPGANDVTNWTDNWFNTSVTHTGLNLSFGNTYYFSVRAENGAGLLSNTVSSDGITIDNPTSPPIADFSWNSSTICMGDSIQLSNSSTDATSYSWSITGGTPSSSNDVNPWVQFPSSGNYDITLTASGPGGTDVSNQSINVTVEQPPIAEATISADTVYLPNGNITCTNQSQFANGYYWDFGDGNTSTDTNPWNDYTQAGNYDLTLVAINGVCPNDTSTYTVVVLDPNGLDEYELDFSMYPNPVENQLNIVMDVKQTQELSVDLLDVTGKRVGSLFKGIVGSGSTVVTIELSQLEVASGTYFVRFSGATNMQVKKLMID